MSRALIPKDKNLNKKLKYSNKFVFMDLILKNLKSLVFKRKVVLKRLKI